MTHINHNLPPAYFQNSHQESTLELSPPDWQIFSQVPNAQAIAGGLKDVPAHWSLTPIQDKAPKRDGWESEPFIPHSTIADLVLKGERKTSKKSGKKYTAYYSGYGLRTGEASNGLVAIDVDGGSAEPILQRISGGSIPVTPEWTSGKPGRRQIVFQVPDEIKPLLVEFNRAVVREYESLKVVGGDLLEFRYNNCQSCLPPSRHPQTGAYKWNRSPSDTPVAIAPAWLCDLLVSLADQERLDTERKKQQAEERQRFAEERQRQRQLNPIGTANLEDVLSESLKRLHVEDIYNWSGHNWHYQGNTMMGCCPRHQSQSGRSFHVNTETLEWWCFGCQQGGGAVQYRYFAQGGNGTPKGKAFVDVLTELAANANVQMPELSKSERKQTISRDEWEWKHGIPNWIKERLTETCNIFKGFGKAPKASKAQAAIPQEPKTPPPKTIKYIPGTLPTQEQYKAVGNPKIIFDKGQRLQLIAELVELGYHDILDSSGTGSGKSFEVGVAEPERFNVDRLWYFSIEHRNPTVSSVEANYTDMPVRNNGMKVDYSRKTALNNPHVRWAREDEQPDSEGNCYRSPIFRTLAEKGYSQVSQEAESNPICGSCPYAGSCSGNPNAPAPAPGHSFRADRRDAFTSDRIRASINSAPAPADLEAIIKVNDDGEETISNRNGAFWDEASRQIQPYEKVIAQLSDYDETWAKAECEMPLIHNLLKPLRLALRPLVAKEYKPTKETYHGYNDAQIREIIGEAPEDIEGIINTIKGLEPSIEVAIREFAFLGRMRLPSNWLIPLLEVWAGKRRGTLRINNGMLTITTHNTRHADTAKAMEFNVYLDATANKSWLALSLDIEASDIVHIEQDCGDFSNLTIIQVEGLGLAGHSRSKSLDGRVAAIKTKLPEQHPDIVFLDFKSHADTEVAGCWWFNHNRGSNEFKTRTALGAIGIPYQNVGHLQDIYITLTGDRNVTKDAPGFSQFVDYITQAEISQCVGRLRANLRPEESLTYYSCADYDLGFLEEHYPGASIKKMLAFEITPEAGNRTEQSHNQVIDAARRAIVEMGITLDKLRQSTLATVAGVSQSRIAQIAAEYGGWSAFKKLLVTLLEIPYRVANNFEPLTEEQEFIAQEYLPLAAEEDPPDAIRALLSTAQAYGWRAFQAILAATTPETRGRLLAAVISGFPLALRDEFKAIASTA